MWKRGRPDDRDAERNGDTGGLGEECEAFLGGEWAEYLLARGEPVPRWAWLNRVAHGPETALRLMHPAGKSRHGDAWTEFRSSVAEMVLNQAATTGRGVDELQTAVLVPIELALFGCDGCRVPDDAGLLMRILAALRHPSAQWGPPPA